MAKNNMLLGYARGKVGDLVFQRRKGVQITKARNRNPNNPRTWAQQMQRVRMYAPVAFYKKATENFYRFAFENKKPNETDYNAFIRENLNAFQGPYFTRSQVQQKYPALAPYIVSSGNLGQVGFSNGADSVGAIRIEINMPYAPEGENYTVAQLSTALMQQYNLQQGDMLTFFAITVTGLKESNGVYTYSGDTIFKYQQFIIDIEDTRDVSNVYQDIIFEWEEQVLTWIMQIGSGLPQQKGTALITTRRSNGKISASESRLTLNESAQSYFSAMSTTQQLLIAAQSYDAQYSALDPKASAANNVASSRTGSRNGESQENIAFGCLPNSGGKTTDGIPPYTLNNECPSCGCPVDDTDPIPIDPDPCPSEQEKSSTRRSSRKTTQSNESE